MTDEELDALDEVYDTMMEVQRNPTGAWQAIQDQAVAITTLRAQLAEAHKDGSQLAAWQCLFDDGKTGIVCDDWGNQYCAMQRRADRAEQRVATLEHEVRLREAALAAQIEADAGIADEYVAMRERQLADERAKASHHIDVPQIMRWQAGKVQSEVIATAIRAQPHDRTALDRYREKVLREAYDSLFKHPGFIHVISGQKFKAVKLEDAAEAILALIEKEKTK